MTAKAVADQQMLEELAKGPVEWAGLKPAEIMAAHRLIKAGKAHIETRENQWFLREGEAGG